MNYSVIDEGVEIERLPPILQVKPNSQSMCQNFARQAVRQMPQITHPCVSGLRTRSRCKPNLSHSCEPTVSTRLRKYAHWESNFLENGDCCLLLLRSGVTKVIPCVLSSTCRSLSINPLSAATRPDALSNNSSVCLTSWERASRRGQCVIIPRCETRSPILNP